MNTLKVSVSGPVIDERMGEGCVIDLLRIVNDSSETYSYFVKTSNIYDALERGTSVLSADTFRDGEAVLLNYNDLRTQKAV